MLTGVGQSDPVAPIDRGACECFSKTVAKRWRCRIIGVIKARILEHDSQLAQRESVALHHHHVLGTEQRGGDVIHRHHDGRLDIVVVDHAVVE